jgi:putative transposase
MPRRPRLHAPGGVYHITLRGNARQPIFYADSHRRLWESLLAEGLSRRGHELHAYCWMGNHVHMALSSGPEALGRFMGQVASAYARTLNARLARTGHLFERRYRAVLVERDAHLMELVRYIHLNPVRAGLVRAPGAYPWSSHAAYAAGASKQEWLSIDPVLRSFGNDRAIAAAAYLRFVAAPVDEQAWAGLRSGREDDARLLGGDAFVQSLGVRAAPPPVRKTLDQIISEACLRHGVTERELSDGSHCRVHARIRAEIARSALRAGAGTVTAVARRFGRSTAAISRSLTRLAKQAPPCPVGPPRAGASGRAPGDDC